MSDECEFCGESLEDNEDTSVACQFCDGYFCGSQCFDAHLFAIPSCGGNPPWEIREQARKRW
jgi:hypothetical protein